MRVAFSRDVEREKRKAKNPPDGILLLLSLSFVVASITSEMRNKRNWIPFLFWHNSSPGKAREMQKRASEFITQNVGINQWIASWEKDDCCYSCTTTHSHLTQSLNVSLPAAAGEVELHTILLRSNNSLMHTLNACTLLPLVLLHTEGMRGKTEENEEMEGVSNFGYSVQRKDTLASLLLLLLIVIRFREQHTHSVHFCPVLRFYFYYCCCCCSLFSLSPANESFRVETSVCLC